MCDADVDLIAAVCLFKPKKKSLNMQDLRLCFTKDTRLIKNEQVAGEYCKLCLYVANLCLSWPLIQHTYPREKGTKKVDAFFIRNGTSHRTHITRYLTPYYPKIVQTDWF